MAIYIDDELRGLTRDFEVNKTMNCGEDLRKCLLDGFSAGVVVIRPGKHTARIQWVGKGISIFILYSSVPDLPNHRRLHA